MEEMFRVPEELTPEEAGKQVTQILSALTHVMDAAIRGAANKARAQALDEAVAVTMSAPFPNADKVANRIHTLERKTVY